MSELRIDPSTDFGARVERRLRDEIVIWLVTVGPSGAPEPAPVWFLWDGQSFVVYSRAGTPLKIISTCPPIVSVIAGALPL